MTGGQEALNRRGADASRSALEYVHGLLCQPAAAPGLDGLLAGLAAAFAASGAGLAVLPSGKVLHRRPRGNDRPPWDDDAELVGRVLRETAALAVVRPGGGLLLTAVRLPGRPDWLLWLEADARRDAWTAAESAALALAGQALGRVLESGRGDARWAAALERAARQQGLEMAARVAARLAHDFGNVLTGIIGFCDLSLALKGPADSQMGRYLRELQRCAQNGAQLTHLLRLFSRRQAGNVHPCETGAVAAEEAARVAAPDGSFAVRAAAADGLPPAAIDAGQLRQILAVLLENARDAMQGAGTAVLSLRQVELSADDCLELYGDARPGPHVEVAVTDAGPGLDAETAGRLFAEPFFSAKPRRRGFGLAVAYGILHAHHGGIRLRPGAAGGTVAEAYLPAAAPAPSAAPPAAAAAAAGRGDRVLVVDDDPNILRFICATLERAGYRAQGASSADEALVHYTSAAPDRFRLVLSDVVMPKVTGVDLAHQLLGCDPNVRVLFMSGQTTSDFPRPDFVSNRFEFLCKPFRPEGLLRAVRGAIDRAPTAARPSEGAGTGRPSVSL